MNNMTCKTFAEVDLHDSFFESLKADYPGFEQWFYGKANERVFVQYDDNGQISGFLYLKVETEIVSDINPEIIAPRILKVGTFKVDAHRTKLGEQFIKVIFDTALAENADVCYVTIFSKHASLIKLVEHFGFEFYGRKGNENVYLKDMRRLKGDVDKDFPMIDGARGRKYILSIYPEYHSVMFPDSILNTENKDIIKDVSYTNSIHKIYVCRMINIERLRYGDILVVYRTALDHESKEYKSVATSVCVVEEVKLQSDFQSFEEFYRYASQYSVFDRDNLHYWFNRGGCKAIKMTYNAALGKRITRHDLIETIGLPRGDYWGFLNLTDSQFEQIVDKGKVNPEILWRENKSSEET